MCGGVRGVSAGGIVSSCYCLMYKLYTLKVTKKQVNFVYFHNLNRKYCFKCMLKNFVDNFVTFLPVQVYALIEHADSPYIRGVGFMFLRYLHLP